jgi:hypothetical protein
MRDRGNISLMDVRFWLFGKKGRIRLLRDALGPVKRCVSLSFQDTLGD